jgi:hypothetical protein
MVVAHLLVKASSLEFESRHPSKIKGDISKEVAYAL